jgi:macrolide transport system ATP-binding/permease protein
MTLSPDLPRNEKSVVSKSVAPAPMLTVDGLAKVYTPPGEGSEPLRALSGIDLKINPGEYVAIIGPSGSGKSTLMQILGLLDRPTSGRYEFLGRDVSLLNDEQLAYLRSRYVGFVFQSFNLLARTTALENVELPLVYSRAAHRRERATAILSEVGLKDRLHHCPHQLSGGQQQRVAIARALVSSPRIIFADEPTGNVNQEQAREILRQLDELHQSGVTIVLVTHDPSVAAHADRVIRIVDGRVAEETSNRPYRPPSSPQDPVADLEDRNLLETTVFKENFKMAINALRLNKLRTGLTMLGIIIGVAAVIAMIALGQGARASIEERLKSLGSNVLNLRPGSPKLGHVRGMAGSFTKITLDDVKAIEELKEVGLPIEGMSSEVSGNVQVVRDDKNWNTRVAGESSNFAKLHDYEPVVGRFYTEAEDKAKDRVVTLGKTVYETLFTPGENPLGALVKINRITFKVIGILPPKGSNTFGDRDDVVIIPLLTAMRRVLGRQYLGSVDIQLSDERGVEQVTEAITELLRKRHRVNKNQEDDFTIRNMSEIRAALSATTNTMSMLLGAIAVISLLVGGIGIMNIMLVSVKERTREIGLRKAIGARNSDVLLQFLIEAVSIGLIGGAIGIVLGAGLSYSINYFFGWATELSVGAVGVSFFFAFVIGVVFGYWPAREASRLSPIEALRYD